MSRRRTSWTWGQAACSRKSPPGRRRAKAARKPQKAPQIAAIVLAAGRSTRMGIEQASRRPRRQADGAPCRRSGCWPRRRDPVIVVTGHEASKVRDALAGLDVTFVDNPDYARGPVDVARARARRRSRQMPMARSSAWATCRSSLPPIIDRLIAAFNPAENRTHHRVPCMTASAAIRSCGAASTLPRWPTLAGDRGARALLDAHADEVVEIAVVRRGARRCRYAGRAANELRSASALLKLRGRRGR